MNIIEKLKKRLNELPSANKGQKNHIQHINKNIPSLKILNDGTNSEEIYYTTAHSYSDEFSDKLNNIVSVWAFPPFPGSNEKLERIIKYIEQNKKNENTLYFFDNLYEGHVPACLEGIHHVVMIMRLNPANVYFFTCGMQAQKLYDEFCELKNITEKINIRVINVWEAHTIGTTRTTEFNYQIKEKEKIFLCFNRNSRKHRIALLGLLYSRGLVDKSYYSFFTECYGTSFKEIIFSLNHDLSSTLYDEIEKSIASNEHKLPLKLNTSNINQNITYVMDSDKIYYDNSYFSLVTETFFFKNAYFSDEESVFFSEKIFKPIFCKHPFIQLNRPYALEYLRKIGYKTFHPFIDESYDTIENDEMRLMAIISEVERLSKQTTEQWIEWQKNVVPIVEHNYRTIISKNKKDFCFNE